MLFTYLPLFFSGSKLKVLAGQLCGDFLVIFFQNLLEAMLCVRVYACVSVFLHVCASVHVCVSEREIEMERERAPAAVQPGTCFTAHKSGVYKQIDE